MKTRIISAAVGLVILAIAIAFYDTIIFNLFIAALAVIGIYEAHHAAALTQKHWRVTLYCALFAVLLLLVPQGRAYTMPALYVLAVLVFAYILEHHRVFTIREGAYALLMGIALPVVFGLLLLIRDELGNEQGILYLAFLLGSAWWSDIGGYFTGMLFGKHKLCPEISPKKTVEGLIGGLVFAVLGNIGLMALINSLSAQGIGYLTNPLTLHFGRICLLTPLLALLSVVGDLSFSIIKRTYGIKDYGNLMPGHGGVLDRFDSVLFIAPAVYFIAVYWPIAF